MKKTYLRATIASLGLLTGTLLVDAQTAAGGGAAGGSAAGAGTASGPAAGGARASGGTAARGTAATGSTIGGASVIAPAGSQPVGAASTIQANPNTIGGAVNSGGIAAPAPRTTTGTLPSGIPPAGGAVQMNTLPAGVQSTLQSFSASGSLGTVTPVPGQPGMFRASVVQNGVPMEMTVASNGRIMSQVPVTGSPTSTPTAATAVPAGTVAGVQAGIPLNSLPPALANSIASQLGGNAQVQSISRDDLANGSVFRVTALQNGVPTEMRFAANGALLSATPLTGTATSAFNPNTGLIGGGGTIIPGSELELDDLPNSVQDAVRAQLGNLEAARIMQQRGTNGLNYVVAYTQDGRAMTMVIGPDGRVLSNGPANVGVAVAATSGTGASATAAADGRTTVKLDELPDDVENALKQSAPYAEVSTITREKRVGGDVYVVAVRDGDRAGEIVIDANGKIIRDDRRDLSSLTAGAPVRPREEKPEGLPYDQLPVAIQNAIKAYATASDLRSITLGLDRDGKTIYDVIFYRDGQRDRMIIAKSGRLVRIEENVSPALELASSRKPPVLAINDLPQSVQDTVRRQTDTVVVKEIQTTQVGGETLYQVSYNGTNGAPMELLVNNSGEVVLPRGDRQNERAGAALQTDVDKEEPDPVRVIDGSKSAEDRAIERSVGAAATSERASGASTTVSVSSAPAAATSQVKLSDTPEAVQNTVKKMAGSGSVERITPKLGDAGVTYEVSFMEEGKPRTVVLDRNGVVQNDKQTSVP